MKYTRIFSSWKSYINESKKAPTKPSHNDPILAEISDEVADRVRQFSADTAWEDMPFYNLFGDHSRKLIFMDVKPDGTVHEIIEFFEDNGWTVDFSTGTITKEMQDFKGNKKIAKMKINKALNKIKSTIHNKHIKPDRHWEDNKKKWNSYRGVQDSGIVFRWAPDTPDEAKKEWKKYHKMVMQGWNGVERMKMGPIFTFMPEYEGRDVEAGESGFPGGYWTGRNEKGEELRLTDTDIIARYGVPEEPTSVAPKQVHDETGNHVPAYIVWNPEAAEFPNVENYMLHHLVASELWPGRSDATKIDLWIDFLNKPMVKGGGPALQYFRENPKVLEEMDKKPIIISRDPIDIVRMSDFPDLHSCHAEDGEYFQCAVREADNAGLVAFLVEPGDLDEFLFRYADDPDKSFEERTLSEVEEALGEWDQQEIFEDDNRGETGMTPIARTRLRRFINRENNYELAVPEVRIYGDRYPGFISAITTWAKGAQEEEYEDSLPNPEVATYEEAKEWMGQFRMTGGSYTDTVASDLFHNMFNIKSLKGVAIRAPHDSEGRYEDSPEYQGENNEFEQMEEAASEVYNLYHGRYDHADTGYEVDGDEHPYVSFWGSISFSFDKEEQTEKIVPEEFPQDPDYDALTNALELIYEENNYYGIDTYNDGFDINYAGAEALYINLRFNTDDYGPDSDGYDSFCTNLEEWDDNYDKIYKLTQKVLRKQGYVKASAIEGRLENLSAVKNFTWEDEADGLVFELEENIPIGYAFNYPAVLASTNWAQKRTFTFTGDKEVDYGKASEDKTYGYSHQYGAAHPQKGIKWHDFARRILNFAVKEAMDAAGKYGIRTGDKSRQEKLPIDEVTDRSPRGAAQEEENFAIAHIDREYNSFLENFIVEITVPQREVTSPRPPRTMGDTIPKMLTGWEEYGQRVGADDDGDGGKLVRGPKAIIPLEMNIIFALNERNIVEHMDIAADVVEWMDNNLDKIQQHAEAMLQDYNKIYLDDIKKRVDSQSFEETKVESDIKRAHAARRELQKDLSPYKGEESGGPRIRFNNMFDMLSRTMELLQQYLDEWKEGEPMPQGLENHWKAAKRVLENFNKSKNLRAIYVEYIKKLESFPSDEEENVHSRFFLWAAGWEPGEPNSPHESIQEARSDLLGDLFQGYESAMLFGYPDINTQTAETAREWRPTRFLSRLHEFDWEREEAYWRAKAARGERRAEREAEVETPEAPVDEGCGPPMKPKTLKIRIVRK